MVDVAGIRVVVPSVFAPDNEVSPEELADRLEAYQEHVFLAAENRCKVFANTITLWQEKELWKHFAPTWDEFRDTYIKRKQEWIDHVLKGVTLLSKAGHKGEISKKQIDEALLKQSIEQAKAEPAREKPGNPAPSGHNQYTCEEDRGNCVNNTITETPKSHGSSNREYLTRVMARDCPEVLDEIGQGKKYKSVRAAALAQGIIKPRITVSWVKDEEPAVIAGKLVEVMNRNELREVYDQIGECFGWG